jgi:hypothetical protein
MIGLNHGDDALEFVEPYLFYLVERHVADKCHAALAVVVHYEIFAVSLIWVGGLLESDGNANASNTLAVGAVFIVSYHYSSYIVKVPVFASWKEAASQAGSFI